jgi:hypothetical protein
MPTLGIFKKGKKPQTEETTPEQTKPPASEPVAESCDTIYLRAMPLREISDLTAIRNEVQNGKILILRITPLATKSIEDVKQAVGELYDFAESIGGDIARLGEERVVVCPPKVKIWREKATVQNEALPTAA